MQGHAVYVSVLSRFEAELNGLYEGFKESAKIRNYAEELEIEVDPVRIIYSGNEKAVEFINGDAEGKGVRHAMLRLMYLREECGKGDLLLLWQSGETIVVDGMTKPMDKVSTAVFRHDVQGLQLLD